MVIICLIYWCYSRQLGAHLGTFLVASAAFDDILKQLIQAPRPCWISSPSFRSNTHPLGSSPSCSTTSECRNSAASAEPFTLAALRDNICASNSVNTQSLRPASRHCDWGLHPLVMPGPGHPIKSGWHPGLLMGSWGAQHRQSA